MTDKFAPDAGGSGSRPESASIAAPSGAPRPDLARKPRPDSPSAAADRAARSSPVVDFLLKLFRAMKGAQFYPENHPAYVAMLEKCQASLDPLLEDSRPLVFEVRSQHVHREGKPLGGELPELRSIAIQCTHRRVKKFHFQAGVEPREVGGFIRALVTDPATVQAAGGVEKLLFAREVRNIWANEINYQDLLYGDQPPVPPEELFAPEEALEPADQIEEAPFALPPDATPEQQDLVKRLSELDAAAAADRYAPLAADLVRYIRETSPPFEHEDVYRALRVFSIHAEGREDRDPAIVPLALESLQALATEEVTAFLVERLLRKTHAAATKLMGLFWQMGPQALPALIAPLGRARTLRQRRLLADTIAGFGEAAIPLLLGPLSDERWYVVRNAVTILGEIGHPSAIPALEPICAHPDPRVPKEAMKSLGRIGSPEARTILEMHLRHAEGDVPLLAAFALGQMRDGEAIPALLAILSQPLWRLRFELHREVIKALAKIGGPAVVPAIGRAFRRRSILFPQRNEAIREVAAQALARINTEESRAILARGVHSSNSKVAEICRAALEGPAA